MRSESQKTKGSLIKSMAKTFKILFILVFISLVFLIGAWIHHVFEYLFAGLIIRFILSTCFSILPALIFLASILYWLKQQIIRYN